MVDIIKYNLYNNVIFLQSCNIILIFEFFIPFQIYNLSTIFSI